MKACVTEADMVLQRREGIRVGMFVNGEVRIAYEIVGIPGYRGVVADLGNEEEKYPDQAVYRFLHQMKERFAFCRIRRTKTVSGFQRKKTFFVHRVDLGRKEEELWNSLHSNNRRCIRQAGKKDVVAKRVPATEENLKTYSEIRGQMAKAKGLRSIRFSYWSGLFAAQPETQLYLAWHGEKAVSGLICRVYDNWINYCYPANVDKELALSAHYAIVWELIRENIGKLDYLDMGVCRGSHREGIERFKKRWGGTDIQVDEYSFQFSPMRTRMIEQLKANGFFSKGWHLFKSTRTAIGRSFGRH
jgi:lipid II:glycine glycyltransferase (peptidoglycan interpeptide bridge formation enzyme)